MNSHEVVEDDVLHQRPIDYVAPRRMLQPTKDELRDTIRALTADLDASRAWGAEMLSEMTLEVNRRNREIARLAKVAGLWAGAAVSLAAIALVGWVL